MPRCTETHPNSVELRTLAIVGELARQNCLDMLRLTSKEITRLARHIYLHEVGAIWRRVAIQVVKQGKYSIVYVRVANGPEPGKRCSLELVYAQLRDRKIGII